MDKFSETVGQVEGRTALLAASLAIGLSVTLLLTGCGPSGDQERGSTKAEFEFNCEDDGRLVERHVDVQMAYAAPTGRWTITYTDGAVAYYVQPPGESCFLVEVK